MTTTILLFVGGYFVLLGVLALAVRPYRARLAALADEILRTSPSDEVDRHVRELLKSAYSIRGAVAQFLGYAFYVVLPAHRVLTIAHEFHRAHPDLVDESRLSEFYDLWRASTAAVNPIFGALMYVAKGLFRLKARACVRRYHADRRELRALQMRTA